MPYHAILIDLDGTLLDTIPDLSAAANAMLAEIGKPQLPIDDICTFVGKGTAHLVWRCLTDSRVNLPADDASVASALNIFNRHYHLTNGREARLYPGVQEGLNAFRSQGVKLAVVTNKPTEFTMPLLKHSGLEPWFDAVVCGDTCSRKKPDPMPLLHACELLGCAPAEALAIGDSINDALAARAAGITVLAVPYGYNEGRDIHTLDIDGIVFGIEDAYKWAFKSAH
ncbi:phosphoglycolate phosphatase [Achromobacter sp. F4_2707]|uniref:phosphoglycolate phosphatase n=1 Tax=Achromobacter sp. F4_2707 TaxID=3114286 RepID=UPI0039C69B94